MSLPVDLVVVRSNGWSFLWKLCFLFAIFNPSSVLWHCWFGDRKGILPVKHHVSAVSKDSPLQILRGPSLTLSNLCKHRLVKLKSETKLLLMQYLYSVLRVYIACCITLNVLSPFLRTHIWSRLLSKWLVSPSTTCWVCLWRSDRVMDLQSIGRGFESQAPRCRVQPWAS